MLLLAISLLIFVSDDDMDALEEELKSLLDESQPDIGPDLPKVPSGRVPVNVPGSDLLSALPAVPQGPLTITDEQLEDELNKLTLNDSGQTIQFNRIPGLKLLI